MKEPIQSKLNQEFKEDIIKNQIILDATNYHLNKIQNVPFGIQGDVIVWQDGQPYLQFCSDLQAVANLFATGASDPAGGWYLVKEQRTWLKENLINIFKQKEQENPYSTIRILEAGVASYIHHYTYLSILVDALKAVSSKLRIALTVIDHYAFPLKQIDAIERLLTKELTSFDQIKIDGHIFKISQEFRQFVTQHPRFFDRISIELYKKDLSDPNEMLMLGQYDIITEHFLTSCLHDRQDIIEKIRQNYAYAIKNNLYLLCASGVSHENEQAYQDYLALHKKHGFKLVNKATSWDPYGYNLKELLHFQKKSSILKPVNFGNTLFRFQRHK